MDKALVAGPSGLGRWLAARAELYRTAFPPLGRASLTELRFYAQCIIAGTYGEDYD